ncbi:ATP-binding protein [Sunxiuqinia sp. A32]|uniref:ATP-binding protein n=1 Tax=Sunxiuqinia sp. A32 TaxID=3461496 RepID=UPI0040458948
MESNDSQDSHFGDFLRINKAEDIYKQMFKLSLLPIIIHDMEMNIIDVNKAALDEFGYSYEEIRAIKVYDLHSESEIKHSEEVLNVMKQENIVSTETSFRRKDGSEFFAEVTPCKYLLENKPIIHVYIKNITERKHNEEKLFDALEKAKENERLKAAFLANMSHEIRTPLNSVFGFSTLLNEENITDSDKKRYASIIASSSSHLLYLINDLIDISKIDAGQIKVVNTTFELHSVLKSLYSIYHSLLISKNKYDIHLKLNLPGEENYIISDETRLRQILFNLLGNALKFTETGSIEFGYAIEDDNLNFFVKDTGIGIPEDSKESIFNRFEQGRKSIGKIYGGTGLGLAIAKSCVQLLDGKIWFESEVNVGTSFFFKIKYKQGEPVPGNNKTNTNGRIGFNNELILVAEDDEFNYDYLDTLLKGFNLRVVRTITGKDTIKEALSNDDLSLILMDIQMPEKNGLEATEEILKHKPKLPIIAQTAYAFQGDREKCLRAGCVDYISKPIERSELLKLIRKNIYIR